MVLGTMYGRTTEKKSLIEVDIAAGTARPIAVHGNPEVRAFALAPDAGSVVAALPAKALMRIVRIPLDGRGVPRELFTVTSDVWHLETDPDGSVLVNLIDRPGDVVQFPPTGGEPVKLAHFPQATASQMVVALEDGRAVVGVNVSGRVRLMAVETGKEPVQLVKTQEDTAGPMTAVAGHRIRHRPRAARDDRSCRHPDRPHRGPNLAGQRPPPIAGGVAGWRDAVFHGWGRGVVDAIGRG